MSEQFPGAGCLWQLWLDRSQVRKLLSELKIRETNHTEHEPQALFQPCCSWGLQTVSDNGLVAKLCPSLATPWTVACQAPLSMGLSKNAEVVCHFLLQGIYLTQ